MPEYDCIAQKIGKMEDKLEEHRDTLERHDRRLTDLSTSLHENTALSQQIADNTAEMVKLFGDAKTFARWTVAIRKVVVWLGTATMAIYIFIQTFWELK